VVIKGGGGLAIMSAGQESTNRWIRDRAQKFAGELGLSAVPMEDPDFDFYDWGMAHIHKQYNLSGQNLEDMVYDVITLAFFSVGQGSAADNYPDYYRKNPGHPFDKFFRMMFVQKAVTVWLRWQSRNERSVGQYAIVPGKGEGWKKEIPEDWLGGSGDPAANILSTENREKLLYNDIPRMLAAQRSGRVLEKVWVLWLKGATLDDTMWLINKLAKRDRNYQAPKGGRWYVGTIDRMRSKIKKLVLGYFGKLGLELENVLQEQNRPVTFQRRHLMK
jgi:hypothetical protein